MNKKYLNKEPIPLWIIHYRHSTSEPFLLGQVYLSDQKGIIKETPLLKIIKVDSFITPRESLRINYVKHKIQKRKN